MSPARPIRLLHLYADLLNLYGENGNLKVLAQALAKAGAAVEIAYSSLAEEPDFMGCDLVYIGCGSEQKQLQALAHLQAFRSELASYLETGGLLLATGNAGDLFGSRIITEDGSVLPALDLFSYHSRRLAEREVGEVLFTYGGAAGGSDSSGGSDSEGFDVDDSDGAGGSDIDGSDGYLVGFQNRGSRIECIRGERGQATPLFNVIKGYPTVYVDGAGAEPLTKPPMEPSAATDEKPTEGLQIRGFFTSSVLGLLTRNPRLVAWLAEYLFQRHAESFIDPSFASEAPLSQSVRLDWPPPNLTTSSDQRFDLTLDVVAVEAFLRHHHGILLS